MSEMPAQVAVGPYRYRVVIDQAVVDAASREMQASLCGSADRRLPHRRTGR